MLRQGISIACTYTWRLVLLLLISLGIWYANLLPAPLFNSPYSTVLEDENGVLMGAKIADDGQWRFPISHSVPEKFTLALLEFEDRDFYQHIGVDFSAIARAAKQNIEAGKIVSGASTLTMQVVRLSEQQPARTFSQKLYEMIVATRLEWSASKEEILALYAAHAPFGGNVVGLETAAWRYYGRKANELSWAESATLAVLPNSPALIHPGRNRAELKAKRDRLLARLYNRDIIDELTYQLALIEPLPNQPLPLPQLAPHYLAKKYLGDQKGTRIYSSIQPTLQKKVTAIVDYHHGQLSENGIQNAAVIVLDVQNREIISYVGNTTAGAQHDEQVNIIEAPRSTGSILKPILYLLMLDEGDILPNTLVPDVPSKFSDYSPKNFSRSYDGAVPASQAVSRSLNVPSVHLLQNYGVPAFQYHLQKLGLTTIQQPPEHYGLSLILGGAEATLGEVTSMYASLAHQLNTYDARHPEKNFYAPINFENRTLSNESLPLSAGAIWSAFEAMVDVQRPEDEVFWRRFEGARKVAWKTGTSFGNRDGWAIGITPDYVVGVWVGNADGEGRPNLTGVKTAGPLLFDVFNALPATEWFNEPHYDLVSVDVCLKSGHRAGAYCEHTEQKWVPKNGANTTICPYHKLVHLNQLRTQQVNSKCTDIESIMSESRFILPPDQGWYYQKKHPAYSPIPPMALGCGEEQEITMQLIYPFSKSDIYVPIELDGNTGKTVFEVAHRIPSTKIYWHLNEDFIGETQTIHQLALSPKPGNHTLTLVDEHGVRLQQSFKILGK